MGKDSLINYFSNHQLDILAYTFPYHMQNTDCMKPSDCHDSISSLSEDNSLENKINNLIYVIL